MARNGTVAYVHHLPPCDICERLGVSREAAYDAVGQFGPATTWAYMCRVHFDVHGLGLGTGRGQQLQVRAADAAVES
jgi:hypothetical protein